MNVDRLINMIFRRLMRQGMNKGIQMAANRGKWPDDMTPEERAQAQEASQTAKKVQRGMRTARRFMK